MDMDNVHTILYIVVDGDTGLFWMVMLVDIMHGYSIVGNRITYIPAPSSPFPAPQERDTDRQKDRQAVIQKDRQRWKKREQQSLIIGTIQGNKEIIIEIIS